MEATQLPGPKLQAQMLDCGRGAAAQRKALAARSIVCRQPTANYARADPPALLVAPLPSDSPPPFLDASLEQPPHPASPFSLDCPSPPPQAFP